MKRLMVSGGAAFVLILALPVLVSAATATTTISSVVSAVITISTSGTVNINTTPTGAGVQTIASDTVTVSTNDTSGYTLGLEENTGTTTLTSGGNTIPQTPGTFASPTAETANHWGYHVDGVGGFTGTGASASNAAIGSLDFAKVPNSGSPDTIKTTSTTASNDTTAVWYGVAVNTSQAAGTYTNVVKYTATAN